MSTLLSTMRLALPAAALIVVLSLTGCAAGSPIMNLRSTFTQRPMTEMPAVAAVDAAALRAENPRVPMAYLSHERTIEHQFYLEQNIWDYVTDIRYQYVVLDPDEERATTFRMGLAERETVEGIHLKATSPSGESTVYTISDLIREQEDGRTTYKFAYPRVEFGTVIEESYRLRRAMEKNYQPPLYQDVSLQLSMPVNAMTYRYIYPSLWEMKIKQSSRGMTEAFDLNRGLMAGYTIITAQRNNLAAFRDEPFSPSYKESAPYLEFAVSKIYLPSMGSEPIFEGPKNWDELAKNFGKYVFNRRGGTNGPAADQARAIVGAAEPDSVRLAAIVQWVQENIEVSDDGASDVRGALSSKKADASLICGLTQAMLEESGLDATFVVIHPASEGFFDSSFIHINQFTAPAVLVKIGDKTRVVFPYIEGLPVTYIPEEYQGAQAMKIKETGFDGFVTLPTDDVSESLINENVEIALDEDGNASITETATLRSGASYEMRMELKDMDAEERKDMFSERVSYDGEVKDFTFTVDGEDERGAPLVVTLRYRIEDLLTITPEEIIFQTGGLVAPNSLSSFETKPGERNNPIRIYHDVASEKTIQVRYPQAWKLSTELADVRDETRFGQISGSYASAPGLLTATQRVELRASRAPATAASNLTRLIGTDSRLYVPTLVFSVGE